MRFNTLLLSLGAITAHPLSANVETITVYGHRSGLIGESISASSGVIGQGEIDSRAMLRSAEMLELIPGMAVTQHSGSGKANQYFIRGFNLDHGTDFATYIDGMPINVRSHGHGQGYTDLNFIIPETIATITYQKAVITQSKEISPAPAVPTFTLLITPHISS